MLPPGLLKRFYLFRDVDSHELQTLEAHAERHHCAPAQIIFRQGEEADAMYLVEVGTVELIKTSLTATFLVAIGSGGGFGEIAFFDRGKRVASARAREVTHLVKIPFAALTHALNERPALVAPFYHSAAAFLSRRLRRTLDDLSVARELHGRRG
jgi:CRP-like cAMP-binding protein